MKILLWHVHGSWTTAFVQGGNRYLVPVLPGRGSDGRGRAQTYEWPESVVEVTPEEAAAAPVKSSGPRNTQPERTGERTWLTPDP